jgi:hypothetical protein
LGSEDGTVCGPKSGEGEHGNNRNFSKKINIVVAKVKTFTAGSSEGTTTATATISLTTNH